MNLFACSAVAYLVFAVALCGAVVINGDCTKWAVDSDQSVLIASTGSTLNLVSCHLVNTRITIFCARGSTVLLRNVTMLGGYMELLSLNNVSAFSDVSVQVTSSVLRANAGPLLGVRMNDTRHTVSNVSWSIVDSVITSSDLTFGVAAIGAMNPVVTRITISVLNSTVVLAASNSSMVALAGVTFVNCSNVRVEGVVLYAATLNLSVTDSSFNGAVFSIVNVGTQTALAIDTFAIAGYTVILNSASASLLGFSVAFTGSGDATIRNGVLSLRASRINCTSKGSDVNSELLAIASVTSRGSQHAVFTNISSTLSETNVAMLSNASDVCVGGILLVGNALVPSLATLSNLRHTWINTTTRLTLPLSLRAAVAALLSSYVATVVTVDWTSVVESSHIKLVSPRAVNTTNASTCHVIAGASFDKSTAVSVTSSQVLVLRSVVLLDLERSSAFRDSVLAVAVSIAGRGTDVITVNEIAVRNTTIVASSSFVNVSVDVSLGASVAAAASFTTASNARFESSSTMVLYSSLSNVTASAFGREGQGYSLAGARTLALSTDTIDCCATDACQCSTVQSNNQCCHVFAPMDPHASAALASFVNTFFGVMANPRSRSASLTPSNQTAARTVASASSRPGTSSVSIVAALATRASRTTTASFTFVPPRRSPLPQTGLPRALTLLMPPTAARSITIVTFTSAQIAGTLSVTAPNKPSVVNRILTASECEVIDADTYSAPDPWQLFPIVVGGSSEVETAVSMIASTTILLLLYVIVTTVYATRVKEATIRTRQPNGLVVAGLNILLTYYAPNIVSSAEVLVRFPHLGITAVVVGSACLLTVWILYASIVTVVWRCRGELPASFSMTFRLGWLLNDFYSGARDQNVWYIRMFAFEDLFAAISISLLGGVYPMSISGCIAVLWVMCLVALLHLCYLATVRPYESRVELMLSMINAIIMFAVAVLTLLTVYSDNYTTEMILAVGVLVANLFYFVQAMILCAIALLELVRNKPENASATTATAAPLLATVPTVAPAPAAAGAAASPQVITSQPPAQSTPLVNPLVQGQRPPSPPRQTQRHVVNEDDDPASPARGAAVELRQWNPLTSAERRRW